jgi:hypothetical protein
MNLVQRIAAGLFAAFLWLVSFGAMMAIDHDQQWLALTALVAGMLMALWALRPNRD